MRRCSAFLSVLVSGGDKYSWMTIFFENLDMYYGGRGDKCRSERGSVDWWRRERVSGEEGEWGDDGSCSAELPEEQTSPPRSG